MPDRTAAVTRAYVGLGSNLGDPEAQLRRAFAELGTLPRTRVAARSSLYRSAPMKLSADAPDQPDYLNAVAALDTALDAHALLDALRAIEDAHGRDRRAARWSARTLDLDLLVFGDERHADERLTVPHPGIGERGFVLWPLCEIAPALVVPGLGALSERMQRVDRRGLERLEAPATLEEGGR